MLESLRRSYRVHKATQAWELSVVPLRTWPAASHQKSGQGNERPLCRPASGAGHRMSDNMKKKSPLCAAKVR